MATRRPTKRPTFLWQGLMIVVPVLALAAVGALSVRQDKALARSEATERAQAVADELLPKLWRELTVPETPAALQHHAFKVGPSGELVFPPPYAPVPAPSALDLSGLSPDQLSRWVAGQAVDADHGDLAAGVDAYREFLTLSPPPNFAAAASYALGLLLEKQGKPAEAAEMFFSVVERYPKATGETGLPLEPLSQWQRVLLGAVTPPLPRGHAEFDLRNLGIERNHAELTTNSPPATVPLTLEGFCSNLVDRPTLLTPYLLKQLLDPSALRPVIPSPGQERREIPPKWQRLWEEHEQSRRLFAAFREEYPIGDVALSGSRESQLAALLTLEPGLSTMPATSNGWTISAGRPPAMAWFKPQVDWVKESTNGLRGASTTSDLLASRLELKDDQWLAIPVGISTNGYWVVCRAESELGQSIKTLVEADRQIPEYLGIGVELCRRKITRLAPDLHLWREVDYAGKGGGVTRATLPESATTVLASASQVEAGTELMRVNVVLTSPTNLYQRQRARAFWFGGLIVAAAASAGMGLLAAYRAFHRQLLLSETKTNFVSSVSHELRAPIAAVRLMAENLERGKVAEESKQREYFQFIVQECRRLSGLVENVLDFSRIEQGRKQYEFEPTDLGALAQQTAKLMEPYAAERQVSLRFALADHQLPTIGYHISADGKAIQQALVNLIDNAIKHSPKNGTVTIGLECGDAALLLWVEDHGDGIPAEEHEKIFERFYRRGSELRRETQGVGIGLSLVKHIVEAHGGRVTLRSAPGQGSRFTLHFPIPTKDSAFAP